ncbi:MAG: SDR family NAD(P)-dependent oxidoreductase [Gammaproteobacteria bacterium]|nr:SDR family NAD(P)-dependent oxidoreductase [Gammaproteobacteria bacterium]MYF60551.1 SDR family NAD(P)-dependent oxidoreductase [Gammaproteobacteria bacterium]
MRLSSSLKGQVAIVTGANSGVGRSAAEMLLGAGAHVTMVCRSRERGERALAELRGARDQAALGGQLNELLPGDTGGARVDLELADLSRQEDVRALAELLAARLPAIDILVNNAGVTRPQCVQSPEGFELTFATNHLGHFLLTRLLRERLKAGRGRIVNVSSRGHRSGDLRRAGLEDIASGRAWEGALQAYADSKLANVLFTLETVRRWGARGITANAVHPGVLATEIWKKTSLGPRLLLLPFTWFMSSPDVGGKAVMNLVEDPSRDDVTGRYFHVLKEQRPSEQAHDESLARELWERSVEWTRGR